jgi:beta-glucanase (GH16 family)
MHIKVDNAFWFFTELPTPANLKKHVGELDVFEIDCGGDRFQRILFNTMHVWESDTVKQGKPMSKAVEFRMPTNPWDDYHLYAIDWEPDQLRCYYDGYLFSRYDNNDWHYPQKLQFDAEIQPEWFGTPKPEEFSSTFYVDYVRAWRRLDLPATPNP